MLDLELNFSFHQEEEEEEEERKEKKREREREKWYSVCHLPITHRGGKKISGQLVLKEWLIHYIEYRQWIFDWNYADMLPYQFKNIFGPCYWVGLGFHLNLHAGMKEWKIEPRPLKYQKGKEGKKHELKNASIWKNKKGN